MPSKRESNGYVTLINLARCRIENAVGFCHNMKHRGYLNRNLMKEQKCLEKQCPLFERTNQTYWATVDKEKQRRQSLYENAKKEKLRKLERLEFIRSVFKVYPQIYITSVNEMRRGLLITYIYSERIDLTGEIQYLKSHYKCPIYLKAIRSSEENRRRLLRRGRET